MQFVKMHGAGNDFVLVDLLSPSAIDASWDWNALAREVCDRHFGVGSDGLLLVLPSERADARMRMFNPDGSESASCGNGIRCLGRYVHDRHGLGRPELRVETGAGVTTIAMRDGGMVTVDMGPPVLDAERIPVSLSSGDVLNASVRVGDRDLRISCVSMGNPHAIAFLAAGQLDSFPLEVLGPAVERDAMFPERTNFEICEVARPDLARVRVWERGAGITLACGTGACATVVAGTLTGRLTPPVTVELPGGPLTIDWAESRSVLMTGPTAYVFTGSWSRSASVEKSPPPHPDTGEEEQTEALTEGYPGAQSSAEVALAR